MPFETRRFITISPDNAHMAGFENLLGAEAAALAYGDGAYVVDTESKPYQPAVQAVEQGLLTYVGYGSFDKRQGLDKNLIEAVKRGAAEAAQAFLVRGADPNATDAAGGTALIWAVARADAALVEILMSAGADVLKADLKGMTPLKLALQKGRTQIASMLQVSEN